MKKVKTIYPISKEKQKRWAKERKEGAFTQFLNEFQLSEDFLNKTLGKEYLKMYKDYFFTEFYAGPIYEETGEVHKRRYHLFSELLVRFIRYWCKNIGDEFKLRDSSLFTGKNSEDFFHDFHIKLMENGKYKEALQHTVMFWKEKIRNEAKEYYNKEKRRRTVSLDVPIKSDNDKKTTFADELPDERNQDPRHTFDILNDSSEIRAEINTLKSPHKEIIEQYLMYIPEKEIAKNVNRSHKTVRNYISQFTSKLREKIIKSGHF